MLFCFRSASLESSHFCDWGTIVSHETVTFIFTLARLPQLEKRNITMTMAAAPPYFTKNCKGFINIVDPTLSGTTNDTLLTNVHGNSNTDQTSDVLCVTSSDIITSSSIFSHIGRGYLRMYLPFINVQQSTISVQARYTKLIALTANRISIPISSVYLR